MNLRHWKDHARPRGKMVLIAGIAAGFLMLLLGAGGFAFAAAQEEHDSFCASCHTQPESTFYARSTAAAAVDLASAHHAKDVRCIDCHSGTGLLGRISAEVMGAQNALKWYTGSATQPAPLLYPIGDDHCLKCHAEVLAQTQEAGRRSRQYGPQGHYHAFLSRWKKIDTQAADCTSCHLGHELNGDAKAAWVILPAIQPVCEACHSALGRD